MRILLAHNKTYYPALGGGDKSNRELMEALARRGHACRAIARLTSHDATAEAAFLRSLRDREKPYALQQGVAAFEHRGVEVRTATSHPNLRSFFQDQTAEFGPDVILTSTDDPAHLLLEAAMRAGPPVAFLARATLALPFGPDCAFPSASKTANLKQVDSIVTVSRYVARYIQQHGPIEAVYKPIALQGEGPFPELGAFENEFVTMVNPCAVKGLPIFLELARRLPETRFAAVPTWGTGQEDLERIRAVPNVMMLEPADHIDEILRRTRVMLVPSLWAEARSRIVVESMLRGVPVMASNAGGLIEAKMGVDYLLPVRLIEKYKSQVNEQMVPVADIPEQDIDPWEQALRRLLSDRNHYEDLSRRSRDTALGFEDNFNIRPFEEHLEELSRKPRRQPIPAAVSAGPIDRLSADKRALLALKLRQAGPKPGKEVFLLPEDTSAPIRLFCFPYAGGGHATYRSWGPGLKGVAHVVAAQLPGREARGGEAPGLTMERLGEELEAAVTPLLTDRTVFFGHSMGAGTAFELVRRLRRAGKPLPLALIVSGARAPQYRLNWTPPPEPDDATFLEQIRRLGGLPDSILNQPEALNLLLPALKADARMYRHYRYEPEPPLALPLRAYGGTLDHGVDPEWIEAWREQTSVSFRARFFVGNHFYFLSQPEAFLTALREDLAELLP